MFAFTRLFARSKENEDIFYKLDILIKPISSFLFLNGTIKTQNRSEKNRNSLYLLFNLKWKQSSLLFFEITSFMLTHFNFPMEDFQL